MSYQWKKGPSATESMTAKQRAFPTRPKLGRPVTDVDDIGRPLRRRGLFEVADESAADAVNDAAVVTKMEPTLTTVGNNEVTDELDDLNRLIAGRIDGEIDLDARDKSLQHDPEIDELDIDIDGLADIASRHSEPQAPSFTDIELVDDRQQSETSNGPYSVKPRILGARNGSGKKIRLFNRFKDSAPATFTNGSAIEIRATLPESATAAESFETSDRAAGDDPDEKTTDHESRNADQRGSDDLGDATNATAPVSLAQGQSSDTHTATAVNATKKSKTRLSAPALSAPAAQPSPLPTDQYDVAQKAPSLRKVVNVDDGVDAAADSTHHADACERVVSIPVQGRNAQPPIAADDNVKAEREVVRDVRPSTRPGASPTGKTPIEPEPTLTANGDAAAPVTTDQPAVPSGAQSRAESQPDLQKKIATTMGRTSNIKPDQQRRSAAVDPADKALSQDALEKTASAGSPGRYAKALKRWDRQAAENAIGQDNTASDDESATAPTTPPDVVSRQAASYNSHNKGVEKAAVDAPAAPASNDQLKKRRPGEKTESTLAPDLEVEYRNIQPAAIDTLPEPIRKSIPAQLQSEKSVNKLLGADESNGTYTVFLPRLDTPNEQKPFGRDPIIMSLMIFSGLFLITAVSGFLMSRDEGADRWIADRVATVKEQANELATNLQSLKPQAQPEELDHESSIQPVSPQPVSPQPLTDSQPQPAAQQPAPQPASPVETGVGDNILTGTLISSNGEPVAGEQIVLMSPSLGARFTTTTRDDGEFALENLMPGTDYALNVTPTGPYKTLQVLDLSVSENNAHLPLTLEAMPTANLSGRIVDADNNAVPNYQLWATGFDEPGQQVNFRSDHEGNYRLYGLPTGKVQFTSKSEPKILITSVVLNGGSDTIVDLVVDYGPHEIGGIATDSDGNPLSGVEITLEWSVKRDEIRSMGTRTASSGPDGSFRFAELGPGKHFLTARTDGLPLIRRSIDVGTDETEIALELGGVDPSSG